MNHCLKFKSVYCTLFCLCRPVVLKVGRIAPLGAILRSKETIRRQNNTKGTKTLNHSSIIELTSHYYDLLLSCKF